MLRKQTKSIRTVVVLALALALALVQLPEVKPALAAAPAAPAGMTISSASLDWDSAVKTLTVNGSGFTSNGADNVDVTRIIISDNAAGLINVVLTTGSMAVINSDGTQITFNLSLADRQSLKTADGAGVTLTAETGWLRSGATPSTDPAIIDVPVTVINDFPAGQTINGAVYNFGSGAITVTIELFSGGLATDDIMQIPMFTVIDDDFLLGGLYLDYRLQVGDAVYSIVDSTKFTLTLTNQGKANLAAALPNLTDFSADGSVSFRADSGWYTDWTGKPETGPIQTKIMSVLPDVAFTDSDNDRLYYYRSAGSDTIAFRLTGLPAALTDPKLVFGNISPLGDFTVTGAVYDGFLAAAGATGDTYFFSTKIKNNHNNNLQPIAVRVHDGDTQVEEPFLLNYAGGSAVYVNPADTEKPAWPAGSAVMASGVGETGLTLNWTSAADNVEVVSYRVYKNGIRLTEVGHVLTANATGLTPDTGYTFKIEAGDGAGNWSDTGPGITVRTVALRDTAAPVWPAGSALTASNIAETSVQLSWSAAADDRGVVAYHVYRGGSLVTTVGGSIYSYRDAGLAPGTTYTFKIEAADTAGNLSNNGPGFNVKTAIAGRGSSGGDTGPAPWILVTKIVSPAERSTVSTPSGSVILELPAGVMIATTPVTVIISEVPAAAVKAIEAKSPSSAKLTSVSPVFKLTAATGTGSNSVPIHNFLRPVTIKISYAGLDLQGTDPRKLGIFRLDETAGVWEYVGGKVDTDGKYVIALRESFSKYAVMVYNKTFSDISGHWAQQDIEFLVAKTIINGYDMGNFAPDKGVTRAQYTVMLAKALALPQDKSFPVIFKDVPQGAWYYGAVAALVKTGIISGYNEHTFAPGAGISREEIAVMTVKAMDYKKLLEANQAARQDIPKTFGDAGRIAGWARSSVALAAENGIMIGQPGGEFAPTQRVTRAQAAVILKRLFEKL